MFIFILTATALIQALNTIFYDYYNGYFETRSLYLASRLCDSLFEHLIASIPYSNVVLNCWLWYISES